MPDVAICTENLVIPALSTGMLFDGEWLEYPPEYFIQHCSFCLPLLIQPLRRILQFLIVIGRSVTIKKLCVEGDW